MAIDCAKFNSYLFRRIPDWDKELARDRFPINYTYTGLYKTKPWASFTGTEHRWDKVHVTMPNDNGAWAQMDASACLTNICDPPRKFTGWGSTRNAYFKYHQDYQSPVFCFDQIRHVEEAVEQLAAIVDGHKKLPDQICSNFIRLQSLATADYIYYCDSGLGKIAMAPGVLSSNLMQINLGSAANLPNSKLTMQFLNHYFGALQYKGYFNKEYMPNGKFLLMTDLQTQQELGVANPSLHLMYTAADFVKGGKFFSYGVMDGVGNWLLKNDPEPLRYNHIGNGVLERVFPYQNVSTTVGKMPQFDQQYEDAGYQLHHVYNLAAREVYVGETAPVNPEMKFLARSFMGKWTWKSPDYFTAMDPTSGTVCSYQNDKKNKGYFLGEYEMGIKTIYPEIEMWILAPREPQPVANVYRTVAAPAWGLPGTQYQTLTPYNVGCDPALYGPYTSDDSVEA